MGFEMATNAMDADDLVVTLEDRQIPTPPPLTVAGPGGTIRENKAEKVMSELTEDEKKTRRIMANRKSAKASRERRRELLATMSSKVAVLTAENRSLAKSNTELQSQAQELKNQLQMVLSMMKSPPANQGWQQEQQELLQKDDLQKDLGWHGTLHKDQLRPQHQPTDWLCDTTTQRFPSQHDNFELTGFDKLHTRTAAPVTAPNGRPIDGNDSLLSYM